LTESFEVTMKTLRVAFLAVVAAIAAIPSAIAADLGGGPPRRSLKDAPYIAPSVFSWTGFYVGAHLGYGWSDVDWENVSNSLGGTGALAGGQIGYNWQRVDGTERQPRGRHDQAGPEHADPALRPQLQVLSVAGGLPARKEIGATCVAPIFRRPSR
jgi:hypothetical protein